jgi:Zn-dependent peptidase ImmA (M78 family)/transcriptional regulator with XRE-family HTH domain
VTIPFDQSEFDLLFTALESFNAERLTVAREAAGFDVKTLAERVGTTPSAISQIENRKSKPKPRTLLKISLALGVPPRFFGGGPLPLLEAERCHFRKKRSATMREQKRVLGRGKLVLEIVRYLEDMIDFPKVTFHDLQRTIYSPDDIEELALTVRDKWNLGLGPIDNMVGLVEWHGVIPVEIEGHSDDLDAFSTWADDRPLIFLSVDKACASRRRWDVAHELGHLLAHRQCIAGDKTLERQADSFAGAFLMPREPFLVECPHRLSWPKLRELKQRWGVSLLALIRRAHDLGRFSEATYRRAHVQYSQFGWNKYGEPDEPAMEHPTLITRSIDQLDQAGQPRRVTEAQLGHGAMFESLIAPWAAHHERKAV